MPSVYHTLQSLLPLIQSTQTSKVPHFLKRYYALKRSIKRELTHHSIPNNIAQNITDLAADIEASLHIIATQRHNLPPLSFDDNLPVVAAKQTIADAIKQHQVVVLCGETGSGKTTQLAKICLELGLGARGLIGHTQPRRIAARAVATRIAEELPDALKQAVGFKIRFSDHTQAQTRIKLMTDGILLTELSRDRYLHQYEVIIIDEAHERSLNIDFLLGILKSILPKRPDLKLIITSATIDTQRFADYFATHAMPSQVPVLEISGRTYPVDIVYHPLCSDDEGEDLSQLEGIIAAVDILWQHDRGNILVFLPSERDIHDTESALNKRYPHIEILPLYARLSAAAQNKVFTHTDTLRIILATNVAETSLTVPGIRYVIDTGKARISRYSPHSRLQRLPIEAIAKSSANQRAGRCGRVMNGTCIRLYSAEDFQQRPDYLDPEIRRTHLSAVLLQMAHLKLGHPSEFPFLDPPETRQINDGYKALHELNAIDEHKALTAVGQELAKLPIDPALGAMLMKGAQLGVLHEVTIIVAALSIQDPRERPLEFQQAATEKHRCFAHPQSDFLSFLHLWEWFQRQPQTQSKMRESCKRHFLSFVRMREWRDLYQQLSQMLKKLNYRFNLLPSLDPDTLSDAYQFAPVAESAIHQALLVGLLDKVGMLSDDGFYLGVNARKFKLFPGSHLKPKTPRWIMCMEIVETTQIFARTCAAINPEWLETLAAHLLKTHYSEPFWSKKRGEVTAKLRLSLYGLPIITERLVSYGAIDPVIARQIMIQSGLVAQDISLRAHFFQHNLKLIDEILHHEDKTRSRDLLIDEWQLFSWYDANIPAHCYSARHLDAWCKQPENNAQLCLTLADLTRRDPSLDETLYPEYLHYHGITFNTVYEFDPAKADDGLTLIVPLAALNLLASTQIDWLVLGLLPDKIAALMKTLPKAKRRYLVPIPDYAKAVYESIAPHFASGHLLTSICTALTKMTGLAYQPHEFDEQKLDKHLRMNIRILDNGGKVLAESRDLHALQAQWQDQAQQAFTDLAHTSHQSTSKSTLPILPTFSPEDWHIPTTLQFTQNHIQLIGYPALNYINDRIEVKLYDQACKATQSHRQALIYLLQQQLKEKIKYLDRQWPQLGKLALIFRPVGTEASLKQDLIQAILSDQIEDHTLPRCAKTFEQCLAHARQHLIEAATQLSQLILDSLQHWLAVKQALQSLHPTHQTLIRSAVNTQLESLIYPGFISQTPPQWRREYPRYLKALETRIKRFPQHIERDQTYQQQIDQYLCLAQQTQHWQQTHKINLPDLDTYRFSIEELRISLFAQPMKTIFPISTKRLDSLWQALALTMKNLG